MTSAPTTSGLTTIGPMIATTGRITLGAAKMFLSDIEPERFARLPQGDVGAVPTNHPAWVYGHLGLYGARLTEQLGQTEQADAIKAPDAWDELFGKGSTCRDDAQGDIYPVMDAIVSQFETSFTAMLAAIEAADDATFAKTNPHEPSRDRFPTVGVLAAFLAGGHPMMHLGQVSAWRRMEGLGSALKI